MYRSNLYQLGITSVDEMVYKIISKAVNQPAEMAAIMHDAAELLKAALHGQQYRPCRKSCRKSCSWCSPCREAKFVGGGSQ
jgi:hypothetical protein